MYPITLLLQALLNAQKETNRVSKPATSLQGRCQEWWHFGRDFIAPPGAGFRVVTFYQRWSREHKARGQGQGHKKISRPRTDPLMAKAKDTDASVLQKKGLQKFFSGDLYLRKPKKRSLQIFPQGFWRFPTKFQRFKNSAVLEPRTGQFSRT